MERLLFISFLISNILGSLLLKVISLLLFRFLEQNVIFLFLLVSISQLIFFCKPRTSFSENLLYPKLSSSSSSLSSSKPQSFLKISLSDLLTFSSALRFDLITLINFSFCSAVKVKLFSFFPNSLLIMYSIVPLGFFNISCLIIFLNLKKYFCA